MFTTYGQEALQPSGVENCKEIVDTPEIELVDKYDLKKCCEWLKKNNFERPCLQFPEDLLNDGTCIAIYLQKALDRVVYVLADTSYGSCCVDEVAAQHVDADAIIHFGHACLSPVTKLPVLYVFEKEDLDLEQLQNSLQIFDKNTFVIIFYDDVYHHLHSELCSAFESQKNVHISHLCFDDEPLNDNKKKLCGRMYTENLQNQTSAVYIGKDSVTLQNLVLGLPDFKWYQFSKNNKLEEYNLNRNKFLMQKYHLIEKIKGANVLGILIGTLGIKNYLDAAERIKQLAKLNKKKYYMLAVGKPNVAKLANFPEIDVFVYIACQENALLKDFKNYYKPVVSLFEVEMALGNRPYGLEYTSDFRELLQGGSFYTDILPESEDVSVENTNSQELIKKDPGTVVEYAGAQYLSNRSWRGLEQNLGETEVQKAVEGRSGIPQAYENELETLIENTHS